MRSTGPLSHLRKVRRTAHLPRRQLPQRLRGQAELRDADAFRAVRGRSRRAVLPVAAPGHVAGGEEEHLPLCVDCVQPLLEGVVAFWDGLREGRG